MRLLLKSDGKSYSLEKFDSDKGIIHLKNTDKTIKKEDIKEFLHVAENEKELKDNILNYNKIIETEKVLDSEETVEKTTKPKSKNKKCWR